MPTKIRRIVAASNKGYQWVLDVAAQIRPGFWEVIISWLVAILLTAILVLAAKVIGLALGAFNTLAYVSLFLVVFLLLLQTLAKSRRKRKKTARGVQGAFSWKVWAIGVFAFVVLGLLGGIVVGIGGNISGDDVTKMYLVHGVVKYGISFVIGIGLGVLSRGQPIREMAAAAASYAFVDAFFLTLSVVRTHGDLGSTGNAELAIFASVMGVTVVGSAGAATGRWMKARLLHPH